MSAIVTSKENKAMNCPKCGIAMLKGYSWCNASSASTIEWNEEEPTLSSTSLTKGEYKMWVTNIYNEKSQVKEAYRCSHCDILVACGVGMALRR